jgi:Cu/Ag efflux pump CusA
MFVEKLVDSFQSGQRQIVDALVKNEEIRKSINELIDAQATYTKTVAGTVAEFSKTISDQTSKTIKEMTEYDWSEFTEKATKTIKEAAVYDWSKLADLAKPKTKSK